MTVIAWDGKMLAADKQVTLSGLMRTATKIRRIDDLLVGVSGNVCAASEIFAWVERGRNPQDFPKLQESEDDYANLLVIENGRVLTYARSPLPWEYEDSLFAIGSGREFALAAMYCGKNAQEAVEIASHFEASCGKGVDVLIPN